MLGEKGIVRTHDRKVLRDLASKQLLYAQSERNKSNEEEWYRHRRMEAGRPMIHIEMDTFEHELIPERLKCESELGRRIERDIYRQILNYELFEDDRTVPDYFPVKWHTWFHLFGIVIEKVHADNNHGNSLGHQFKHVITDISQDMPKLQPSTFGVDREGTLHYMSQVEDIIGDLLPVKLKGHSITAVPTQVLVHLMGMEAMFLAMYDTPDLFKQLMDRIARDYIAYFRFLESQHLLMSTRAMEHLGQGTFCFNEVLPSNLTHYKASDVWGFMDSQETVGISPAMFGEFIFPCYKRIAKEFGMLSYGCCEPVHNIWEDYLSTFNNLTNVSISPWCDEVYMGQQLKGKKIIYHRKPSPNYLGVNQLLDEEAVKEHIRKTLVAANGCQLEFAQRDVYTIHNNPEKVRRYVEIIRQVCQGG